MFCCSSVFCCDNAGRLGNVFPKFFRVLGDVM